MLFHGGDCTINMILPGGSLIVKMLSHHCVNSYYKDKMVLWPFNIFNRNYMTGKRAFPDNKVHGANMGPTLVLSTPDGPHVCPMNLAMRIYIWTRHGQGSLNIYYTLKYGKTCSAYHCLLRNHISGYRFKLPIWRWRWNTDMNKMTKKRNGLADNMQAYMFHD